MEDKIRIEVYVSGDVPSFDVYQGDLYLGVIQDIATPRAPFQAIEATTNVRLGDYFTLSAAVNALVSAAESYQFVDIDA